MKRGMLYVDGVLKRSATVLDVDMMFLGVVMGALVEGMGRRGAGCCGHGFVSTRSRMGRGRSIKTGPRLSRKRMM